MVELKLLYDYILETKKSKESYKSFIDKNTNKLWTKPVILSDSDFKAKTMIYCIYLIPILSLSYKNLTNWLLLLIISECTLNWTTFS
jgi:hypothetical protein